MFHFIKKKLEKYRLKEGKKFPRFLISPPHLCKEKNAILFLFCSEQYVNKDFQKIMSIFTNFKDIKFLIAKSCGNDYKRLKMKSWPNIALRSPKYLYTNTSNNTLKVRNVLE